MTHHPSAKTTLTGRCRGAAAPRRLHQVVLATAGALACATGIAVAAIPDSSATIHGCYSAHATSTGAVSPLLLNDPAHGHCPTGLSPLSFNQTGPPGPTGHAGPEGPAGAPGPAGPAGPGATFFTSDLSATAIDSFTRLGVAGPETLNVSCQRASGAVYAVPALSGPAGHADLTVVNSGGSTAPSDASTTSSDFAASSMMQLGLVGVLDGEPDATSWIGGILTSGHTTVLLQLWAHAANDADGHSGSCHFAAIVTPAHA